MTRLAKPGDIAIIIQDEHAEGRNIGKQCSVERQCPCYATKWMCTALEPQHERDEFGELWPIDCGGAICYGKTHLIVKEDPDAEREEKIVDETLQQPRHTAGVR